MRPFGTLNSLSGSPGMVQPPNATPKVRVRSLARRPIRSTSSSDRPDSAAAAVILNTVRSPAMPRRRWRAFVAVPAAAAVVIAGVVLWIPHQGGEDAGEGNTVVAESSGEESMHHIMEADDLIQGKADASGARLDIVSSASMGKSGAMVDGQPELKEGMGAQVWAISEDKTMTSAGVIGQDPHDGVWMPFETNAVKVMVTEEPAAGSAEPTGRTLVEVRLS